MLRITETQSAESATILKLEGRLAGVSVEELRRLSEAISAREDGEPLVLDLGAVSFVDADGIALLRRLCSAQVEITRCSPFVAQLLEEVWPCS